MMVAPAAPKRRRLGTTILTTLVDETVLSNSSDTRVAFLCTAVRFALMVRTKPASFAAFSTPDFAAQVLRTELVAVRTPFFVANFSLAVVRAAKSCRQSVVTNMNSTRAVTGDAAAMLVAVMRSATIQVVESTVVIIRCVVDFGGAGACFTSVLLTEEGGCADLSSFVTVCPSAAMEWTVGIGCVGAAGSAGWIVAGIW